jgi:adenylosuccinate synthase
MARWSTRSTGAWPSQGVEITPDNLRIAENAVLILPLHRELDALREDAAAGKGKIGTTGAASARPTRTRSAAGRSGSWTWPMLNTLPAKIERLLTHHNALRRGLGEAEVDRPQAREELKPIADRASCPSWTRSGSLLTSAPGGKQRILFEGAQGIAARHRPRHLSVRHLVQHHRGAGGAGRGIGPGARLRARHREGLHHARRRGAVSDRAVRRDR